MGYKDSRVHCLVCNKSIRGRKVMKLHAGAKHRVFFDDYKSMTIGEMNQKLYNKVNNIKIINPIKMNEKSIFKKTMDWLKVLKNKRR